MSHAWLPEEPQPTKKSVTGMLARALSVAAVQFDICKGGLARLLRLPHELHRRVGRAHLCPITGRHRGAQHIGVEYQYVKNTSGDGMVVKFGNGVPMTLSRGDKYWHGSCGMRFEGTDGWVACGDGYKQPEVSSPALLEDGGKLLAEYMDRTQRP